jgi:hypothetical protein
VIREVRGFPRAQGVHSTVEALEGVSFVFDGSVVDVPRDASDVVHRYRRFFGELAHEKASVFRIAKDPR